VTTKYPNQYYNVDSTGKITKHIFAGDQAVAVIETVGGAVTPRYIHNDQLGSSSVITTDAVQYNHPPRISLIGADGVIIPQNGTYTEQGATATDDEDGMIMANIVTTGTVDTSTPGSYQKTYSITDSGGLKTTVIRNVFVRAPNGADSLPQPSLQWKLNGTYNSTAKHASTGSMSGYSLANTGGYTSIAGKDGTADSAMSFNGAGDYVTAPTITPSSSFTIGMRFKKVSGSYPYLLYEGNASGSENIGIYIRPDDRVTCEVDGFGAVSYNVNIYDWTDVVCVKSGNMVYVYMNGVYHNYSNAGPLASLSSPLYLGRAAFPNSQAAFAYNGGIDEVKYYDNLAMNTSQVAGIFSAPSNNPPTLTITGQSPQIIQQGTTFTDPGATATDTEDGTIPSGSITTTGTVNTAVQGTYTLTYSVTDSGGLTTKQARTVAVVPSGNLQPTEAEVTDYFPYGSQRFDTGTYSSQRKFIGQYYDPSSDLSFLNARYYDGTRGQFLSQDPVFWWNSQNLTNPQSLNSYSYANGNPIGNKDPLGLFTLSGTIKGTGASMINSVGGTISFIQNVYGNPSATLSSAAQGVKSAVQSIGSGKGSQVTQNFFFGTDEQQDEILGGIVGDAIIGGATSAVAGKATAFIPKGAAEKMIVNDLLPTHYPTQSRRGMQQLVNSMRENGVKDSVKYVKSDGKNYIVDGNNRYFASGKAGIGELPVEQVSLPYSGYTSIGDLQITGKMPSYWKYIQ
jgi:RHS repeat-associated protein